MSQSYDLVCIGGGIAGMVAGVRAAERGLRVAVLEKGAEDRYPCNTRWSGGIIHISYADPTHGDAVVREAIGKQTAGATETELAEAMIRHCGPVIHWLRDQGMRFIRAGLQTYQNWTMAPPRPLVGGIDWMGRGPDVLLRLLADKLAAKGGTLRRGARAVALRMEGGACTGVELEGGDVIAARAVVVADGGFQANQEMFGQHITPQATKVKQRGAATGMGDGLRMALAAGAAVTELDRFYGHLLVRDAFFGNDKVWPYPELDAIAVAGMLVDAAGNRITDEGLGGISIANALAKSTDPLGAHIICDTAIWDGPGKAARIPANPQVERGGGTVHRADTLAALAAKAGIPADALAATVAAHNAALENGGLDKLDPPRSTLRAPALPIRQAPFVAIPVCAGITYTMGGIAIDAHARVKHRDGGVIPGLYAAGACTGGIEGGPLTGYVGGLSKSATFGFLAAEHAAVHVLAAEGARA